MCNQKKELYGANSVQSILSNWGIKSSGRAFALSFDEVKGQINAIRPFVVRFGWKSSKNYADGHFVVGRGYIEDFLGTGRVYYIDPTPGKGYLIAKYSWMRNASDHQWTHTLLTANPLVSASGVSASAGMSDDHDVEQRMSDWSQEPSQPDDDVIPIAAVPEPETLLLVGIGIIGLISLRKRK